jgi:hypothetical protein
MSTMSDIIPPGLLDALPYWAGFILSLLLLAVLRRFSRCL